MGFWFCYTSMYYSILTIVFSFQKEYGINILLNWIELKYFLSNLLAKVASGRHLLWYTLWIVATTHMPAEEYIPVCAMLSRKESDTWPFGASVDCGSTDCKVDLVVVWAGIGLCWKSCSGLSCYQRYKMLTKNREWQQEKNLNGKVLYKISKEKISVYLVLLELFLSQQRRFFQSS